MSTTNVGEAPAGVEDEERDLRRAVLNEPDEDGPRLAYARWCEANGRGDRAVFIAVQLWLAGQTGEDFSNSRRLRRAERTLVGEHGRDWAGQIAEWAYNYQFDRGFVELVTMSARCFLKYAEELFDLAPIRHLNLTDAGEALEDLLGSGYLRNIRSLAMDRCQLTDRDLVMLVNSHELTQLRWLSIGENEIGPEGVAALAEARDLKLDYVRLFGNPCDPGERYAHDSGRIVERWLPNEGRFLEERYQRSLPWLHLHHAKTVADVVPNRFRQTAAGGRGAWADRQNYRASEA